MKIDRISFLKRDDFSEMYFSEIKNYKVLSDGQFEYQYNLYKNGTIKESKKAFDLIINSNLRFVVSIAKKFQNLNVNINDLINAGNVGLILALDNFDISRGFKFITYAVWYIKREIQNQCDSYINKVKIPTSVKMEIRNTNKLPINEFNTNYDVAKRPVVVSINEPINNSDDSILYDILRCHDTSFDTDIKFKYDDILNYLNVLNEEEKFIIINSFGLYGVMPKTYKEISLISNNVSPAMIRVKREKALYKMKKCMVQNEFEKY